MPHNADDKKKALTRIRRVRGQVDGLERALQSDVDCGTVLQQLAAIRGAVNGLMAEVLQTHIQEEFGVSHDAEQSSERVQAMTKLVRTYLK